MKKLRVGVFGLGRGSVLALNFIDAGADVTAICDQRPASIITTKNYRDGILKNAVEYNDFDEFIKHDMDAVLICNYFCNHAEYSIKAMRAGKHVISETLGNVTMAEGVELCRVKEETGKVYALLENYPFFKENLEMKRVYEEGTLGQAIYAEGEYIHPMSPQDHNDLAPGELHWRNWTPRTYYTSHAIAPLMMITGATPTKVNAVPCFRPEVAAGSALNMGDAAAVILCQTDIGAVLRIIGWGEYKPHGNFYRVCGSRGGVAGNNSTHELTVGYSEWTTPEGKDTTTTYLAEWPDTELGKLADNAGHGGGDFMVIKEFVSALQEGREPYFDVYKATSISSVAILAWRSILNNGATYDIPDFRKEEDRKKYENDTLCPFPRNGEAPSIPCSSQPYAPSEEDLANARKCWENKDFLVR